MLMIILYIVIIIRVDVINIRNTKIMMENDDVNHLCNKYIKYIK